MNNRKLFKETFSPMHVSERTISEVIEMTQNSRNKPFRLPRVFTSLAACLALVLGLAITANAATNGKLLEDFSFTIMEAFRINDYKQILTGENGMEITALGTNTSLIDRDGRAILVVGEDEVDITDALDRDGAYTYERNSDGTICRVEVTGTLEDWTMTTAIFDEGMEPAVISTQTSRDSSITISDEDGDVLIAGITADSDGESFFYGEGDPETTTSIFTFGDSED